MKTKHHMIIAAVALFAVNPVMASTQGAADGSTTARQAPEDNDDFPWGLLGLLGLAGLIPRKREVHVDKRTAR